MQRHRISERRACRVIGQHRSTQRYQALVVDEEAPLIQAMNGIAARHPRYGYRMVCQLLRDDGWAVNRKRIERLWRLEGHRVPPRRARVGGRRAEGTAQNAAWNRPATAPNEVWSYDFVSARTCRGGAIRILNVVDEFTRVCLGSHVSVAIGSREVIRVVGQLFATYGAPKVIRSDNGREFTADTVVEWLGGQGVEAAFIEKASPQQNPYVERFNGTMRNEVITGEEFDSVLEARIMIGQWRVEYNTRRPHRGLGMKTPAQFAREHGMRLE
jgi:transposase InsO family protein